MTAAAYPTLVQCNLSLTIGRAMVQAKQDGASHDQVIDVLAHCTAIAVQLKAFGVALLRAQSNNPQPASHPDITAAEVSEFADWMIVAMGVAE